MWRSIGIMVLAIVLGYGSNALSQSACLENAAFWYSHVMMSSQPFYVKLEPGQEHIQQALVLSKLRIPSLHQRPRERRTLT
jgi:hypothetical protein